MILRSEQGYPSRYCLDTASSQFRRGTCTALYVHSMRAIKRKGQITVQPPVQFRSLHHSVQELLSQAYRNKPSSHETGARMKTYKYGSTSHAISGNNPAMPSKQIVLKICIVLSGLLGQYVAFHYSLGLASSFISFVTSCSAFVAVHLSHREADPDRWETHNKIVDSH